LREFVVDQGLNNSKENGAVALLQAIIFVGIFGLVIGAVGIYFALRERRQMRQIRAQRRAAEGEAQG